MFDGEDRDGVHTAQKAWSPSQRRGAPRRRSPTKPAVPRELLGEGQRRRLTASTRSFKNEEVRV